MKNKKTVAFCTHKKCVIRSTIHVPDIFPSTQHMSKSGYAVRYCHTKIQCNLGNVVDADVNLCIIRIIVQNLFIIVGYKYRYSWLTSIMMISHSQLCVHHQYRHVGKWSLLP